MMEKCLQWAIYYVYYVLFTKQLWNLEYILQGVVNQHLSLLFTYSYIQASTLLCKEEIFIRVNV